MALIEYLKEPTWENFGKIIQGIGIFVIGLGTAFLGLPAIIAGVIILIIGTLMKYWDQIKAFLESIIENLKNGAENLRKDGHGFLAALVDGVVNTIRLIKDTLDAAFNFIRGIFDGFIQFFKGVFTGDWQMALEGIKNIFLSVWYFIRDLFLAFVGWIYAGTIKPMIDLFTGLWDKLKQGASNAWEGIKSVFSTVVSWFKNIFTNAWTAVKNVFSTGGAIFTGIKDGIVNAFKRIVNAIIAGINRVIVQPFNAINNVLRTIKNVEVAGIRPFNWIWTISIPQIPYLKTGGIINMPGRGVNLGGAIGGEAGREGVLPLTDQQAMAELGKEIGKWIVVNASITNSMNGRILSREIKRIENEQEFAFNN